MRGIMRRARRARRGWTPPAMALGQHSMRPVLVLSLLALAGLADGVEAASHTYTRAERYAGCMFGETIPLMRRGTEREKALSIAADRCIAWSEGLSTSDIEEVDIQLHRAIERSERSGL